MVTRRCEVLGTMKPSPKGERRTREGTTCLQASLRVGARVDGMEKVTEPLLNVVRTNKPKTLLGLSQKARGWHRCFPFHLSQTLSPPAEKRLLTHPMARKGNVVSPASSPAGDSEPQGKPMGCRVEEDGKSEGHPVMGWIGIALIPRASELTSIWSFVTRALD